jgi:hypothetical protein
MGVPGRREHRCQNAGEQYRCGGDPQALSLAVIHGIGGAS